MRLPLFLLFGFTALWCIGFYLAPIIPYDTMAAGLYALYQPVCHQLPDHSFLLHGSALAVCTRCTAVYSAFFFGIIVYMFLRTTSFSFISYRYYIIVLAVPMIVDVAASWTTGYNSTIITRVVSGGLFGFGAALLIVPVFTEAVHQLTAHRSRVSLSQKHGDLV